MGKYLVVVDMQNDFVDGSLGTKEALAIVDAVAEKIKNHDGKVIFTYDTHFDEYEETQEGKNLPIRHCIFATDGWELNSKIDSLRKELEKEGRALAVRKGTFGSSELGPHLATENARENIDSIELVGLCTDVCVISNAMIIKAFLPEVPIIVDSNCCAGVTPESNETALNAMRACQIAIV